MGIRFQKTGYRLAYGAVFLALLFFLLWKCRYGYAHEDEAFYLTIPYRLCMGDSLILHEWHLSQLSGFLIFPVMKLYLLLAGSTEGILLRFRLIFTVLWAAGALFFFLRLRKFSQIGAMGASLAFLLYAPFGIMALSYNSMGILLLLSAGVIAATAEKHRFAQLCLAGVFFAGAVLCCPYLLLLYVLLTLLAVVPAFWKKKELLRFWLPFSVGCAILLAVFCASLLSRCSVPQLRAALPQLFRDPEHESHPLVQRTFWYLLCLMRCSRFFPPALALAVGIAVVSKIRNRPGPGFLAVCLLCLLLQISFLAETPYINYIMFPINLIAPYCALHSSKPGVRIPFLAIWLPGLLYTYCIYLSSNQAFFAVSSASTVMTAASLVILGSFGKELVRQEGKNRVSRAAQIAVLLLLTVQLGGELSLRYSSVFWEPGGMAAQTELAGSGPERGILMTPERKQHYELLEEDAQQIRGREDIRKILFLSTNTHLYLSTEKEMASYSAWLSGIDDGSLRRLEDYFTLLPEKSPDGIYLEPEYRQYAERFSEKGYEAEELPSGAVLLTKAPSGS